MLFGGGVALLVRSDPAASVQAASPKAVKRDGIAVFFNESSFIRSLYIRPNYVMPFAACHHASRPIVGKHQHDHGFSVYGRRLSQMGSFWRAFFSKLLRRTPQIGFARRSWAGLPSNQPVQGRNPKRAGFGMQCLLDLSRD